MSTPTPPLPDVGWPITLVFATGIVSHTVVVDGLATRTHFLVRNVTAGDLLLDIADESVHWLRGHHLLDSDSVRAALAAGALGAQAKEEPTPLHEPIHTQLEAQRAEFERRLKETAAAQRDAQDRPPQWPRYKLR